MDVEKTIGFLLEQQAAHQARHEAEMAEIREMIRRNEERFAHQDELLKQRLDRAVRLSVEEHRRERRRRKELESKMVAGHTSASAAIASLAQTVDRFIQARQNGGNGNPKA